MKTPEAYFTDWEAHVFGFGYGTGEEYTIAALKLFMANVGREELPNGYDYQKLEGALTPHVAWLLINTLCHADIIEYGMSPRYGWLTPHGERLKAFTDARSVDQLLECTGKLMEDHIHCYPDHCNCDDGKCNNPFWPSTQRTF